MKLSSERHRRAAVAAACLVVVAAAVGAVAAQHGGHPPPPRPEDGGPPPQGRPGDGPPPDGREGPDRRRPDGPPDRRPGGGPPTFNFVAAEMRFPGPLVREQPFSATAVYESAQTLADGTKISRTSTGLIARDHEGRLHREMELNAIGPFVVSGPPPRMIVIDDPVAEEHYILDPNARRAQRLGPPPPDAPGPGRPERPPEASGRTESLGKQTIDGVVAEGTRSTITIPTGQIGNDRPIEIVSERWYAPDLQVVVRSTHDDPRVGRSVYRLTNLERKEPDHSLFVVPSDYRIEDRPPEGPGPRPRRRPDGD